MAALAIYQNMSPNLLLPEEDRTRLETLRRWLRLPAITVALLLIVYYTVYLVMYVPTETVYFSWQFDNSLVVTAVPDNSPAAPYVEPGDVLLAVDGRPVTWTIWHSFYTPGQASYTYTIERSQEILTYTIPVLPPSLRMVLERITSGVVALLAWLVAALVLLVATPQNDDAWQLGLTTLGTAVVLAASEAALYGVPMAWISSYPFLPFVGVALVQLAWLPRQQKPDRYHRSVFRLLYAASLLLGAFTIMELVYLNRIGYGLVELAGISIYELLYVCLAVSWLAHLLILFLRYRRMPNSYQKQQIFVVMVFTGLALLPAIFLTIIPRLLLGFVLLPWVISIALLALIPAGYGFVIFRRKYLGLEIFATNALTSLLITILLLAVYTLASYLIQQRPSLLVLEPLPTALFLLPLLMLTPYTGARLKGVFEQVVYGVEPTAVKGYLTLITSALAREPHTDTLFKAVKDIGTWLQIRHIALLLNDGQGNMVCVDQMRIGEDIPIFVIADEPLLKANVIIRDQRANASFGSIFKSLPRVNYVVPLVIGETAVGLLLLGRPVPDGFLNARQIAFVRQVADVMAVAVEAMRLFDASRAMSRDLMQVRDTERMQLASMIHDEPVQHISMMASQLNHLAGQTDIKPETMATEIKELSLGLQEVSKQLRQICAGLHPPILKQGAQLAVKEAVYNFRDKTDLDIEVDISIPHDVLIPQGITVAFYYVLQEALNNINKHANTTTARVSLSRDSRQLVLTVEDDGEYSETATFSLSSLIRAGHFGLVGMYEWAKLIEGQLTIVPREQGGTMVMLTVPCSTLTGTIQPL